MIKKIVKSIILVCMTFIVICCASVNNVSKNEVLGSTMRVELINGGGQFQIDSLIKADTLPNINKWLCNSFIDYETNKRTVKRMYIKNYNDGTEIVYIIVGLEEPYKITKRISK